jgi:hypothetical protein
MTRDDFNAIQAATRIVVDFNNEPPASPRRSPPLATMIANAIRDAVEAEREACARTVDGLRADPLLGLDERAVDGALCSARDAIRARVDRKGH